MLDEVYERHFKEKKKEKPQGGVIMRIESIKNQTYPIYKAVSFKDDTETETTAATQPMQPVQADTIQFKSAAGKTTAVKTSIWRGIINAFTTPDPHTLGVPSSFLY